MNDIHGLTTEAVNPKTKDIDTLSALEIVSLINEEDMEVAKAIQKELPQIAEAVEAIAQRFAKGGRIIYCGAGSSGRIGTMDAVELLPTYNVPSNRAFGLIAGGKEAMWIAVEGAEDNMELAREDLKQVQLSSLDSVIGIAASGRTPYTIAALAYANEVGALSISISSNAHSAMASCAQISIAPIVGAEVVNGSTRMKAGTAQKMVANMLSTGVMVRIGKVYHNYMVNVVPTNEKLVQRAKSIISQVCKIEEEKAAVLLEEAQHNVAAAIVMECAKTTRQQAVEALTKTQNNVRCAIASLHA